MRKLGDRPESSEAAQGVSLPVGPRLRALFDAQTGQFFMPDIGPRDRAAMVASPDDRAPLVAIIDTGVLEEHPLLKPRIAGSADFTGEGPSDRDGHGTEVALTLVLDAPNVRLLSAKVIATGPTPSVQVQAKRMAEGIGWAVQQGARELNISVGFVTPCGPAHEPLCTAVRNALDHGVGVEVAGEATCPAQCDSRVVVVGEVDDSGGIRSNVPPTFVSDTWGKVAMVPWEQWTATIQEVHP